jgi:dienelactone hydrolase
MPDAGTEPARITPRFEPSAEPMAFGAVPWPDDLYLDETGRVSVGALPNEDEARPASFPDSLRLALGDLDGFSPVAPIFFYFEPGSIDPTSLPENAAASTVEGSSVFLLEVDPLFPNAFEQRVPVNVHWNAELGQLALRPADGHALEPRRQYAAFVTTGVRDDRGDPIGPHPLFREVRDAEARPQEPVLAEAWDRYTTVIRSSGIARERVAGLAVFTVQRVAPDLRDARTIVWDRPAPSMTIDRVFMGPDLDALLGTPVEDVQGTDVEGGVVHSRIAWVVHGSFMSPSFLSETDGVHGRWTRDETGALRVLRDDSVPFTIALPPATDLSRVPVVIYQHGLGAERSAMFAVADALAAVGIATIAIDIPFHGMRASNASDLSHRYGATEGPDGFGDVMGQEIYLDFLGIIDDRGELPPFHPAYVRDVFRQSVVDLMGVVRALREGDWSLLRATAGLEGLAFAPEPIGFVGVSLGGIIGTIFVASEQEIGAAVLNVTGGDLGRLVEWSAVFAPLFLPILLPRLGLDPEQYDPAVYPASFYPELAIFQTILDRGDSMSFAPLLEDAPIDVLFQMAADDEVVPNRGTEALARAAGAVIVSADPAYTDLARREAPLVGNLVLPAGIFTRGLYRFEPATHGLLSDRESEARFEHPPAPPFIAADPVAIVNPVDASVAQAIRFFESHRSGAAEIAAHSP